MKKMVISMIATALCASAVHADGPVVETVVAPPVAQAAAVPTFSGFYGGLEYGRASSSGDVALTLAPPAPPNVTRRTFNDGDAFGVFVGYNRQNGNFVYGGEFRYLSFSDVSVFNFEIDDVLDVRGRVGYAAGSFLFYGALGWSWANTSVAASNGNLDGMNYGVGIEYNVTERVMLGLDYTARNMDGDFSPNAAYDGDVETVTFRIGMRF
mgnify:CR=1 FL=1|jgi:outer membrane immunogenic protein